MNDAPERIWAVPERNCTVYMSGNSPITAQDGPFTHHRHGKAAEYIRADLVPAPSVTIKPLEWVKKDGDSVWTAGAYTIRDDGDGFDVDFCGINLAFVGHDSRPLPLDGAERIAQKHHEHYVLAAIQVSPASDWQPIETAPRVGP